MRRIGMALALLALVAAPACGPAGSPDPVSAPTPGAAPDAESRFPEVEVSTARVRRGSISQRLSAPGSLMARRESRIGAEVRGRIEQVFVREGERVEVGDPLFQIDREPYEMALRQAEAGLDLARSERLQIAADLERAGALHRKAIVAEDQLDRIKTQLAVARARERQAAEAVALAQHNLAQTLVHAPFAGSIAARLVDEGTTALVQPQTIVVVIQETAELEARADIPESQLSVVRRGDRALIHVEGLPGAIESEVVSVGDTIDPATRTYRVKMRVPNADGAIKAGVFAHIEILPQAKSDALLVPRDAIRSEGGRTRVLVVRDGRAEAVPVHLGLVTEGDAEVLDGIGAGTEVIIGTAAREIAPGMRVRVVDEAQGAAS